MPTDHSTPTTARASGSTPLQPREFTHGDASGLIYPPRQGARGTWEVVIEDMLGEQITKVFPSRGRAFDYFTEVSVGIDARRVAALKEEAETARAVSPNRVGQSHGRAADLADSGSQITAQGRRGKSKDRMNLTAVADVLAQYSLNPAEELAKILTPVVVVDQQTGAEIEEHRLDPADRARVLLELQQYVAPKLKAVEVSVNDPLTEMTEAQLAARAATLIGRIDPATLAALGLRPAGASGAGASGAGASGAGASGAGASGAEDPRVLAARALEAGKPGAALDRLFGVT
jgi:hypothetical protein